MAQQSSQLIEDVIGKGQMYYKQGNRRN